jgi:hypothetical protein
MHLDILQPTTKEEVLEKEATKLERKCNLLKMLPLRPLQRQKDQQTFLHLVQSLMLHER